LVGLKGERRRRRRRGGTRRDANEELTCLPRARFCFKQYIKEELLPKVNSSPDWKKKCNAVKRQITPKIGQIINSQPVILRIVSSPSFSLFPSQILLLYTRLSNPNSLFASLSSLSSFLLFSSSSLPPSSLSLPSLQTSEISLILHSAQAASPEIYIWILNHLSKILIKQAETEVTAKPSAAFPLARMVVGLMRMGHAEGVGKVLFARMVKKCPWVVPFYPARKEVSSDYYSSGGGGKGGGGDCFSFRFRLERLL